MARYWVRYVMPVMVEVDDGTDEVTRVVTLPEEIREDRDDSGHFLVYDEGFVRRHDDTPPHIHAQQVARPEWPGRLRGGPPQNWPDTLAWEEGFDLTDADDRYGERNPYGRRYETGEVPHHDDDLVF